MNAVKLWDAGFKELVSVIPPGATLSPTSKIPGDKLGKIPGIRKANGTWVGYNWLQAGTPSKAEVKCWDSWGANVGVLASSFPGLDIDCDDAELTVFVAEFARRTLGVAPVRRSRHPRALLMYRTEEPFERQRVYITRNGQESLVEMLGDGRQYLVSGTHPSGAQYEWEGLTTPNGLTVITREQTTEFMEALADAINGAGYNGFVASVKVTGSVSSSEIPPQEDLLAPNEEELRACVESIPNNFPDREDYIRMGYAIKAAGGDLSMFQEWAGRWEGGHNAPETVETDWENLKPPYQIGWEYLRDLSGDEYNGATTMFEVISGMTPEEFAAQTPGAGAYGIGLNDSWVRQEIAERVKPKLRYVPQADCWHVWDGSAWTVDVVNASENVIHESLFALSQVVRQRAGGCPDADKAKAINKFAASLNNLAAFTKVIRGLQSHPDLAVRQDVFDTDMWLLNTPGGVIDLRDGSRMDPDPSMLLSKSTAVSPADTWVGTRWELFLQEATNGNVELQKFLQKQIGYSLTGSMQEQSLCFIHGPPLTGKTVFIEAVTEVFGSYHTTAAADTFSLAGGEKHSTDLAMLVGSRLVTTVETQEGHAWDTRRVKAITGGDRMTARFLYEKSFEFRPTFKVLVVGNYEPEIKGVDDAMMRRLFIVPFTTSPAEVDRLLLDTLRKEAPAILAWAIEGCALWLTEGLAAPEIVQARTEEYKHEEDPVGLFLEECCVVDEEAYSSRQDLFNAWRVWCSQTAEEPGSLKSLRRRLKVKMRELGVVEYRPTGGSRGYKGIRVSDVDFNTIGVA